MFSVRILRCSFMTLKCRVHMISRTTIIPRVSCRYRHRSLSWCSWENRTSLSSSPIPNLNTNYKSKRNFCTTTKNNFSWNHITIQKNLKTASSKWNKSSKKNTPRRSPESETNAVTKWETSKSKTKAWVCKIRVYRRRGSGSTSHPTSLLTSRSFWIKTRVWHSRLLALKRKAENFTPKKPSIASLMTSN